MVKDQKLENLRRRIDTIDEQLVLLIKARAEIAQAVGRAKQGAAAYHPNREAQVLSHVAQLNTGPLPDTAIQGIFREIIAACRNLQQTTTIAYLGPAGSYSEAAARSQFGQASRLVPYESLTEVFGAAEKGTTQLAVVPIENSIEGTVNLTLDLLRQTSLLITGEILLPIHHQLLSRAGSLSEVTEVIAHPQALAQCHQWVNRHLPHATRHETTSNSEGARLASKRPNAAAIAGSAAAELYQLSILAQNIEDLSTNTTRFLILGTSQPSPTGSDKSTLICITPNRPGALYHVLDCLARHNVNMTKLEARPSRENNWDYIFYIDIQGHQQDKPVGQALADLRAEATFVKNLGSYPQAQGI